MSLETLDAFHYAKLTGQDQWEYPRKMDQHFLIKPDQLIGMAPVTFYSFSEFPN